MAAETSLVGTTIQGRYHLVRQLGDGGMGAVFKAADQILRRFVAIKLLHSSTGQNPSAVERFVREARAAAAIGHPNIIDILDFGHENGRPYLVMEYLRGRPLSHAIAHESPFDVQRACGIATHSLAGLAAAHDRGILHRDLKPANLMLVSRFGDRDFVKVCDFGFATLLMPKQSINDGKNLTPARTLVGTPAYAAPERLRGDDRPDPRTDVYSMGVVLYEVLTGHRPFDAPTFQELAAKVKNDPPPSVRKVRPDIPKALEQVVTRSLAKNRDERWPTAEEFAAALVPFGGHRIERVRDEPSDSFTMDLLRLRARETAHRVRTSTGQDDEAMRPRVTRTGSYDRGPSDSVPSVNVDIVVSFEDDLSSNGDTHGRGIPAHLTIPEKRVGASAGRSRSTGAGTAVAPSRVERPVTFPPPGNVREVSGKLVLATMRHVAVRFSARALKEVLDAVPDEFRPLFRRGVAETDWVPFRAYETLQQVVDARLGRDDMQLIVQCGRASADPAMDIVRAKSHVPAEVLLAEIPQILGQFVHGIGWRVRSVGRGYGSLELIDGDAHSLHTCVSMLGFIDRCFSETSAKELEVNSVSCRALGDETCTYDLSWIVE